MKIRFSKLLSLLMAVMLLLTFVSCNSQQPPVNTDPPPVNTEDLSQILEETGIKNIILIIGDGMGNNHIAAGEADKGSNFAFHDWKSVAVNTDSVTEAGAVGVLTDSAAAATALATGVLTVNDYTGVDREGNELQTILDYATKAGKATGITTTDNLFGATPGAFSAHTTNRDASSIITKSQVLSDVNLLCGLRNDLIYKYCKEDVDASKYYYTTDLNDSAVMTNEYVLIAANLENDKSDSVSLSDATKRSLEYLERDEDGFVLMIEQAFIDKESHSNLFPEMIEKMRSLDETVKTVMDWVGDRKDTLVIVTADHETGGLSVSQTENLGKSFEGKSGTIYYKWTSTSHTAANVTLYVYGCDVSFEKFDYYAQADLVKNCDIFDFMKQVLDNGKQP